jgi:RNA polymerase sigma-70 factor (ECF subfamily)
MSQSVVAVALALNQSDEIVDLVERARRGERQAYGDLVERYWSDLVALARGILASDLEAEDLVQEALIHAWRRLGTLRRPESFGAWIRRVVARRCLSLARRRRRSQELVEMPADDLDPGAGVDAARLLATLAPRQRAVLYLTWIEGCSDREAGGILGIGASTVRVHRHRGLQRLRQRVEEGR